MLKISQNIKFYTKFSIKIENFKKQNYIQYFISISKKIYVSIKKFYEKCFYTFFLKISLKKYVIYFPNSF